MASYHWSMQIIGRKDGRSAVRAAAYRAGQDLLDERTGEVHRFGQRRGVYHSEILLPRLASSRLGDRQTLWNEVERVERRDDAQLAREVNIALPHELSRDQQLDLIRNYVQAEFVERGMIADLAVHIPRPGRGEDERNVHAHVMLTLRQPTPQGLHSVKTREWNSRDLLKHWRSAWAEHANRALANAGHQALLDAGSLEDQRVAALARGDEADARSLAREPELHMGPNAVAMTRASAWRRARSLSQGLPNPNTASVPDKFAENALRIERNQRRAWQRHADAKVHEVRLARRAMFDAETGPRAGSNRRVAGVSVQTARAGPVAKAAVTSKPLRKDSERRNNAFPLVTFVDAQARKSAKPYVQITAKDVTFAFYRMGLLSREQLNTSLELIEAERALQRASARQESFWSRVLPRSREQAAKRVRPLVRRRHRANDPTDP